MTGALLFFHFYHATPADRLFDVDYVGVTY